MEDQVIAINSSRSHSPNPHEPTTEKNEPVRSRWTPKPEQILILESIFNSGMVNPPKEETIKIRKLLEKFGSVGDANVFYWFQNRRSRSRRRQRQIQATFNSSNPSTTTKTVGAGFHHQYDQYMPSLMPSPATITSSFFTSQAPSICLGGGSSSSSCSSPCGVDEVDGFQFANSQIGGGTPEFEQASSVFHPSDISNLHYQSAINIMVFINGVPTEVQRGPVDMRGMFGEDVVLVHSSGVLVPFNDHGFSIQGLQHGESYFLVTRQI